MCFQYQASSISCVGVTGKCSQIAGLILTVDRDSPKAPSFVQLSFVQLVWRPYVAIVIINHHVYELLVRKSVRVHMQATASKGLPEGDQNV